MRWEEQRVIPPLVWLWPVDGFGLLVLVVVMLGPYNTRTIPSCSLEQASSSGVVIIIIIIIVEINRSGGFFSLLVSCVESFRLLVSIAVYSIFSLLSRRGSSRGSSSSQTLLMLNRQTDRQTDVPPPQPHQTSTLHLPGKPPFANMWTATGQVGNTQTVWRDPFQHLEPKAGHLFLSLSIFPRGFPDAPTSQGNHQAVHVGCCYRAVMDGGGRRAGGTRNQLETPLARGIRA